MLVHLETPRLFLHNFLPEDAQGIFALDTDPKVMKYLGGVKMTQFFKAEKTIEYIQKQYKEHGIGRLAIIEKSTDKFVGWSGLKLEKGNLNGQMQSYDLGYRLLQQFLGKGYATESATASLKYGFEDLNLGSWQEITSPCYLLFFIHSSLKSLAIPLGMPTFFASTE